MIAITIRNLRKSFGSCMALDSINLDIQPGELFFLLGPSGCGKTTLLRHIAGFYEPDDGRDPVRRRGRDEASRRTSGTPP